MPNRAREQFGTFDIRGGWIHCELQRWAESQPPGKDVKHHHRRADFTVNQAGESDFHAWFVVVRLGADYPSAASNRLGLRCARIIHCVRQRALGDGDLDFAKLAGYAHRFSEPSQFDAG